MNCACALPRLDVSTAWARLQRDLIKRTVRRHTRNPNCRMRLRAACGLGVLHGVVAQLAREGNFIQADLSGASDADVRSVIALIKNVSPPNCCRLEYCRAKLEACQSNTITKFIDFQEESGWLF